MFSVQETQIPGLFKILFLEYTDTKEERIILNQVVISTVRGKKKATKIAAKMNELIK